MKRTPKGTTAPTAKPVLKLAPVIKLHSHPKSIYSDCVNDLRLFLSEAESGELIGITYAVMYRDRNYYVNAAGEAEKSPTFARGMVRVLDDFLSELVNK